MIVLAGDNTLTVEGYNQLNPAQKWIRDGDFIKQNGKFLTASQVVTGAPVVKTASGSGLSQMWSFILK
jgi:hypothetical protein